MLYGAYLEPVPYGFEDPPQADCWLHGSADLDLLLAAAAALAVAVAPTRRLQHAAARGGA